MAAKIVIVDYGMGNLHSVGKKLLRLNVDAVISRDPRDLANADKIILPGVGHFKKAMEQLRALQLLDPLNDAVIARGTPILGICLGMQLMAAKSEEGSADGLGWVDGSVVRFTVDDRLKFKVPHCGWNQIHHRRSSDLMKGIPDLAEFYFVHSYHWSAADDRHVLNQTEYAYTFTSAIERDNIWGVQYHPEKSHDVGERLLSNFVRL